MSMPHARIPVSLATSKPSMEQGAFAGGTFRLLCTWLLVLVCSAPATPRTAQAAARATTSPVLLILNDTPNAPFGEYLAELLRYEGLAVFDTEQLVNVNASLLSQYRLTVLAPTALSASQAALFMAHVGGGGRLLAIQPDAQIKVLFGLLEANGVAPPGYMRITPSAQLNGELFVRDLITDSMQVHVPADRYALDTAATEIARLYSDAATPTVFPAVAAKNLAAAFTYDVARNIAYIRQGRTTGRGPAPRSVPVTRTAELYQGWVDLDRVALPQADEQIRLLGRMIRALTRDSIALPQAWYFPGRAKGVLLPSADSYASLFSEFEAFSNTVSAENGQMSYFTNIGDLLGVGQRPNEVDGLRAAGHSAGVLIYAQSNDMTYGFTGLSQAFQVLPSYFSNSYGISPSLAYHSVEGAWEGWTTAAELASTAGMRMSLSADHIGSWLQKPDGRWVRGHVTGGGRPLRYVTADGAVLPLHQQPVQIIDRQLTDIDNAAFERLPLLGAGLDASKSMIDASVNRDYAALAINMRLSYAYSSAQRWLSETLRYGASVGVPAMSADAWLRFTEARNSARYTDMSYDSASGKLAFNLRMNATPGVSLTTLLPPEFGGGSLVTVTIDGIPVPITTDVVRQQPMAFIESSAGDHTIEAIYVQDAPLSGLTAANSSPTTLYRTVYFTATVATGSNPTFVWDFGDGNFATGATVSHAYTAYPTDGRLSAVVRATNGQTSGDQTLTYTSTVRLNLPMQALMPILAR